MRVQRWATAGTQGMTTVECGAHTLTQSPLHLSFQASICRVLIMDKPIFNFTEKKLHPVGLYEVKKKSLFPVRETKLNLSEFFGILNCFYIFTYMIAMLYYMYLCIDLHPFS